MGYQVKYATYNPGQYPAEVQVNLDEMTTAGWRIHTAMPAYNELYILWERDDTAEEETGSHRRQRSARRDDAVEASPVKAPPPKVPAKPMKFEGELSPAGA